MRTRKWYVSLFVVMTAFLLVASACGDDDVSGEGFKFGMILVGSKDDRGWSQAHFEAGEYVEQELGAEMILFENLNDAVNPGTTVEQVVGDMIAAGAELVFATSDDQDEIKEVAPKFPDTPMIWASGDSAWQDGKAFVDVGNLGNVMGKMEFGKMIAGCAAALTTQSGSLAYLGPLINDETRRLANSAYLGARYCYDEYRGLNADDLEFQVTWIGFWFEIPGVTLSPTQVANDFFGGGADVVISGIDTTEAIVVAGQRAAAGEDVWAVPYDFEGACNEAPERCLGTPYFNWGPAYLEIAESVITDDFESTWVWLDPDWDDINDKTKTAIGWVDGDGLPAGAQDDLDDFISGLADGDINLFTGPLNYQDGTQWLADGEEATDFEIWYTEQLLEGMVGASE